MPASTSGLGGRIGTALELAVAGAWRGKDSGRHDVEGDLLFYLVQSYTTKPREGRSWESHRTYVDVQCIVQGEESIGWSPISRLSLTQPYDATSDAARYSGSGDLLTVRAGMFAIFWPQDGHLPAIAVRGAFRRAEGRLQSSASALGRCPCEGHRHRTSSSS